MYCPGLYAQRRARAGPAARGGVWLEAELVPGAGMPVLLAASSRRGAAGPERGRRRIRAGGQDDGHPAALPVGQPARRLRLQRRRAHRARPARSRPRADRRQRPADPRGDRRAPGVGADRPAYGRRGCARGAPFVERGSAGAVRGVPVPPRAALPGALARRAPGDRGNGGRVRRRSGSDLVRLSPVSVATGRSARGVAGRAAR